MTKALTEGRRELALYAATAGVVAFAIAAAFHLHPWPTPLKSQADALSWDLTAAYLLAGALGVAVLPWTGVPLSPTATERARWLRIVGWALAIGALYGATDIAINELTPWGAHIAADDKANGYRWANVGLPWSLLHYAHASILSECAFRLAPILILTWLVSRVLLRGRYEAPTFWILATLSALIEPLEKAILLRKWPLDGLSPMEQMMMSEAVFWQFIYAVLLRRFGWASPIIARYGYYLVVRIFGAYVFWPDTVMPANLP